MTLTEFLLARVAEDEERAKSLRATIQEDSFTIPAHVVMAGALVVPMRILVDCIVKRRIIEIHTSPFDDIAEAAEQRGSAWESFTDDERTLTRPEYLVSRNTLRVLALLYADHPDYRIEWRMS